MELFSLLAKLTLDSKDFDKGLDDAQKKADGFEAPEEQTLELDTSEYDSNIAESESLSTGFTSSVGSAFEGLKTVIATAGVVGAITGIVNGLKEAVNLTADQYAKVTVIFKEEMEAMQKMFEGGGMNGDFEQMRKDMEKRQEEQNKKLKEILTEDQFTKWQKQQEEMRSQFGGGGF